MIIPLRWLFIAAAVVVLTGGCASSPQALESKTRPHLLVASQIRNDSEIEAATMLLEGMRRVVKRYTVLSLDKLSQDSLEIHYSGDPNRYAVDEFVVEQLTRTPSSVKSLASSLKRVSDYGKSLPENHRLVAVIVTEGFSEPSAIEELQGIVATIPPSVTLYLAGVAPEHRSRFSRVVHPIRDRAVIVGQGLSSSQALIDRLQ